MHQIGDKYLDGVNAPSAAILPFERDGDGGRRPSSFGAATRRPRAKSVSEKKMATICDRLIMAIIALPFLLALMSLVKRLAEI